jgi:hypothetical protein
MCNLIFGDFNFIFIACILLCVMLYETLTVKTTSIWNINKSDVTIHINSIQLLLYISVDILHHLQAVSLSMS